MNLKWIRAIKRMKAINQIFRVVLNSYLPVSYLIDSFS